MENKIGLDGSDLTSNTDSRSRGDINNNNPNTNKKDEGGVYLSQNIIKNEHVGGFTASKLSEVFNNILK
jgi:hypothetical protein